MAPRNLSVWIVGLMNVANKTTQTLDDDGSTSFSKTSRSYGAEVAQSVQWLDKAGRYGDRIQVGGARFSAHVQGPWGPPPFSVEVKERVHIPPSRSSRPVLGATLLLPCSHLEILLARSEGPYWGSTKIRKQRTKFGRHGTPNYG